MSKKTEYSKLTKEALVTKLLETEAKLSDFVKTFDCHVYFEVDASSELEASKIAKDVCIIVKEYFAESENARVIDWGAEESW